MNDQEGQHQDKQFGSYRLIKLLGEGGFAEVYLGEHVRTGTQAALKVLATKLADDEIALFRREAQMMIELDHPNIIHIYDYGMEGRIPFIVMAYASNGSLRQLHPKSTCLPLPTIINYVKQIADGLQYMHNKRLIHRDLKPENMLIGINGKLLLSDFGIAAIAHSTNSLQTQGQSGTIYYMAPEQLQGKPRVASDQYALGVIIYEWLCGHRPFTGTYTEIATQQILVPPQPLHRYIPDISPDVEQVVMKALAKDSYERFASIVELSKALEHAHQSSMHLHKPISTDLLSHPIPDTASLGEKEDTVTINKPFPHIDSTKTSNPPPPQKAVPINATFSKAQPIAQKLIHPQKIKRRIIALLSSSILFILFFALLAYFIPSANVTITLLAQNYSAPIKLVSTPNNQPDAAANTVQEIVLKKDFMISGTGLATGTTKVGTASATGTVFFTNNGNQEIIIPSSTVLSTSNGIQFVIQDNIALGPKNSALSREPSFIQAQVSGDSGNVPAGSITIIPSAAKAEIEQYNNKIAPANINLQVTNDDPTSGGGVGNAISVMQKDLDTTQTTLSSQLQNSVNTWVQQHMAPGDVTGKPIVASILTNTPKVGTIEQSGTFSANLKQSIEVAVVHRADLQTATIAQLNASLNQDKNHQNYQIASDSPQPVQIPQFTPISNGLSMTLNFTPTGKIIQKISNNVIKSQIRGKTVSDAEITLKNLLPTIQRVNVKILPVFFPLTPLLIDHINVKFVALLIPQKK